MLTTPSVGLPCFSLVCSIEFKEQTMISPTHTETVVVEWTVLFGTIIFCAGYLWHRLKEAFPELFKQKTNEGK
jgi:hypothetical protein